MERLTTKQMAEKYPERFLGLSNIKYASDGSIAEADVIYTDKTEKELRDMEFGITDSDVDITCWFTTADMHMFLGMAQCSV